MKKQKYPLTSNIDINSVRRDGILSQKQTLSWESRRGLISWVQFCFLVYVNMLIKEPKRGDLVKYADSTRHNPLRKIDFLKLSGNNLINIKHSVHFFAESLRNNVNDKINKLPPQA